MQKVSKTDRLLDLRPQHASDLNASELTEIRTQSGLSQGEIDRELHYLRLMSARKVNLPNDSYFAEVRQKINSRVSIRKISIWDRAWARFVPAAFRPLPASIATAAIAVAVTLTVVYYPHGNVDKISPLFANSGPYVSISEMYCQHVESADQGQVTEQELREYREILLMSTAILGSPSSLSRSRSLAQTGM